MKLPAAILSKLILIVTTAVICVGMAYGQSGNPYDTSLDNPYLKKKSPTPGPSASAGTKTATKTTSDKDTRFLSDAGSSFGWEIKTGSAAEKNAKDAKTKQVATRLVGSYSKLAKELADLGAKKGRAISVEGAKAQNISGADYDKRYLNLVQQDHQQSISAFRKASQSADDPDVRAWAKKTLPILQQNQGAAK